MAKLIIRITNQPLDNIDFRKVEGLSGREYIFKGNKEYQSFIYEPKELPFEVGDIFNLMTVPNFPWRFEPVLAAGDQGEQNVMPAQIVPWVTPDKYADHLPAELITLAVDCGFSPKQKHDPEAVRAQLDAYFVGRAVGEKTARAVGTDATDGVTPPAPPNQQRKVPAKVQGVLEV